MQPHVDADLLKRITAELLPDLTKALKLFKTRLSLLVKIIKQPCQDYEEPIRQISTQEADLIAKYQQIDRNVLSRFQMEFQRLFCRIIEAVQAQKKNTPLQGYVSYIETIIRETIANDRADYICTLASIYGKGRTTAKGIACIDKSESDSEPKKQSFLNAPQPERRVQESAEKRPLKTYSYTVRLLADLDIDLDYHRDSSLYIPSHQDETYSEMAYRNRFIAGDIGLYKRLYTQNLTRRQRRAGHRGRRLIPSSNLNSASETQIVAHLETVYNPETLCTEGNQNIAKRCNTTVTSSFKNHPVFSASKQNKAGQEQRKAGQPSRSTQAPMSGRQITPKKIFFCFNKLALKPVQQEKPAQFTIRRMAKQCYQTRIKFRDSAHEVLIQGKKIQEVLELLQARRRVAPKGASYLFI